METENRSGPRRNPLWTIFSATIWIGVLFLIAYIGINVAIAVLQQNAAYNEGRETVQLLEGMAARVAALSYEAWQFIKPFLQIIVILIIVEWILDKFGISLSRKGLKLDWNVQTILALVVISAFALAALSGANTSIGALKDLALVVVGFYFGTQRKTVEVQTERGKATVIEEHDNDVIVRAEKPPSTEKGA